MKGATEDLSMTAIAVVAIAAIGIVFTTLVWPAMKNGIERNTKCSAAFSCTCSGDTCSCLYAASGDEDTETITCPASKVSDSE